MNPADDAPGRAAARAGVTVSRIDRGAALTLLAISVGLGLLWDQPFVLPLKLLTVLFHELGHALAALATGGHVGRIELNPDQSGACWSSGGSELLVLPAGYLGSMLIGGVILLVASRTRADRYLSAILGVVLLAVTVLFIRNAFGLASGLAYAAVFLAASRWAPDAFNDLLARIVGLASMLYAVLDIKDDLVTRTVPGSDAWAMSQRLFLPPVFWGVLWIAIALAGAFVIARAAVRVREPTSAQSPGR
jgi:hypothetical protein